MKMKFHNRTCWILLLMLVLLSTGCGNEQAEVKSSESAVSEQTSQGVTEDTQRSESQSEVQMSEDSTTEAQTSEEQTERAQTSEKSSGTETEELAFPHLLDSDRLELASVFEYAGINPDCEDVYAEDIGALQLKNISGKYLESAKILVRLANGDTLNFLVEDIPAEMEILAFETGNQTYDDTVAVVEISAEAEYSTAEFADMFSCNISGSDITVENISGEEQNNITLYYHCTIDGLCFGGQSYELSLGTLNAGESVVVSDTACYMGDVTVTNIVAE